ncbi:MAG: MOSC domain-containing protein [bacterium]|nr:MOSC domain-containing protein [bacterium]
MESSIKSTIADFFAYFNGTFFTWFLVRRITKLYLADMKVVATNIGEKQTVEWKGQEVITGIFKYPAEHGIVLEKTDVKSDAVVDRKYHGGIDKACYAYSADHYDHWKDLHPDLEWSYGMFGENLTVEGLDEKTVSIGDTFQVGEAVVQVSEPRQPCMKLNVRMDSSLAVKHFVDFGRSGTYFRVLKEGKVQPGDEFVLQAKGEPVLPVFDVFQMIYEKGNDTLREIAKVHPALAETTKSSL